MSERTPAPRTGLTAQERDAWQALLAVVERLPAVLDAELRRAAALTHFEYRVLVELATAPGHRLPMATLAGRTGSSLTRLSHVARRLEGRGVVERRQSVDDGRVTIARLTAAGLGLVAAVGPGYPDLARRHVLDRLTTEQVGQLAGIAEALAAPLGGPAEPGRSTARPSRGDTGRRRSERSAPWARPGSRPPTCRPAPSPGWGTTPSATTVSTSP